MSWEQRVSKRKGRRTRRWGTTGWKTERVEQDRGHGKRVKQREGARQGGKWYVRAGQGRATYGRARNGMARQEQGKSTFSAGQGRVVARAVAGTGA